MREISWQSERRSASVRLLCSIQLISFQREWKDKSIISRQGKARGRFSLPMGHHITQYTVSFFRRGWSRVCFVSSGLQNVHLLAAWRHCTVFHGGHYTSSTCSPF
jgi:hypothetical protein